MEIYHVQPTWQTNARLYYYQAPPGFLAFHTPALLLPSRSCRLVSTGLEVEPEAS